jgi:hypothetical protein
MITGPQIKAARALLGWSVPDLARRASIEIAEIQDIENVTRPPKRRLSNAEIIQATLEDAGPARSVPPHSGVRIVALVPTAAVTAVTNFLFAGPQKAPHTASRRVFAFSAQCCRFALAFPTRIDEIAMGAATGGYVNE